MIKVKVQINLLAQEFKLALKVALSSHFLYLKRFATSIRTCLLILLNIFIRPCDMLSQALCIVQTSLAL